VIQNRFFWLCADLQLVALKSKGRNVCLCSFDYHHYCNDFGQNLSASVFWKQMHVTRLQLHGVKNIFPKDLWPFAGLNSGWIFSKCCVLGVTKYKC